MKVEPLIVVKDVPASSAFYQSILLCESGHGGNEYEMLILDGNLILQLHARDVHDHPGMYEKDTAVGNGVLLWFRTGEFESAVKRVIEFSPEIVVEPHINPNAQQKEIWFKDLDGYMLVISSHIGDAK